MKKVIERKCSKCDSVLNKHFDRLQHNRKLMCNVCSYKISNKDIITINDYVLSEEQHKQLTALAHNLTATNPAIKKAILNILKVES